MADGIDSINTIPTKIFIIPYRNREVHKQMFIEKMQVLLEDEPVGSYEIHFAHQNDSRPFNRGAMKNIGFLAMKNKYPSAYKNITFVFNDVDTIPTAKGVIKDYNTTVGIVKHFYGFEFALGGIFSITGADFEKTKGFPNFWGWGLEDNTMNDRCLANGLSIDRSNFYEINHISVLRLFDGFERTISKRDSIVYKYETPDNMYTLKNIKWNIVNEYVHITNFNTDTDPNNQVYGTYNIQKQKALTVPKMYMYRRPWKMFNTQF
jgi:hypothetical protein